MTLKQIADAIRANVADVDAHRIDWNEECEGMCGV